jgi:hypothetical protein
MQGLYISGFLGHVAAAFKLVKRLVLPSSQPALSFNRRGASPSKVMQTCAIGYMQCAIG